MRRMVRRLPLLALLIAALIAVEPLLHHHPLQTDGTNASTSACAICATQIGRLPIVVPTVPAPQVIVTTIIAPVVITLAVLTFSPRASRAPPAA